MANNIIATGTVNALGFESEAPKNFAFATWRAIPFSPDGPAVFRDGTKVPIYQGQLDANGSFNNAPIGDTNQMRPPGVSYMFSITPVASVPPITLSNVQARAGWPVSLGTLLTAMISPLRIQAAPLVYAYSDEQIINPTAGCGYVNTTTGAQWVFVGAGSVGMWIEVVGAGGGGGDTTPGGPNNSVQFNAGGVFGGDGGLLYSGGNLSATGKVSAANLLSGTTDTTYQLHIAGASPQQALIETTSAASFALLWFKTPAQLWQSGVGGPATAVLDASGKALAGHWYLYDATVGNTLFDVAPVTGNTRVTGSFTAASITTPGTLNVGDPAASALVISPAGGYQGAPTLATANGGPVDLSNFGDGIVMQDSSGDVLSVIAAGHLAIQMFAAGGQEWGEINNTNAAFNVAAGAAATNGIHLVYHGGGVSIQLNGQAPLKTYNLPTIADQTASRAFNTAYQNTSGMTLAVSMTGLTSGSSIGTLQLLLGPANPPANLVSKDENTASVSGAEVEMKVMVPPGWWYEVQSSGDITGIGRWWEWTCP